MKKFAPFLLIALSALAHAQNLSVTGTVSYRERIALPRDAVVNVELWDVSKNRQVSSWATRNPPGVPVPFNVPYPASAIDSRDTYELRASISVEGITRWRTSRGVLVITKGASSFNLDVIVEQASGDLGAGEGVEDLGNGRHRVHKSWTSGNDKHDWESYWEGGQIISSMETIRYSNGDVSTHSFAFSRGALVTATALQSRKRGTQVEGWVIFYDSKGNVLGARKRAGEKESGVPSVSIRDMKSRADRITRDSEAIFRRRG
jgi:putative lipoprotein